jgi:type 1 fimbria pilin
MTLSLDYIATNSLPCRSYLDFTNVAYTSIVGATFTQLNLIGNTDYDFISTGLPNHPTRGDFGIQFTSTQKLSPRVSGIISGASSYSLLIVSKNSNNSLLKVGKTNPNLPKLLEIDYNSTNFAQNYSRLNVADRELTLGDLETTQVCLLSHDVVTGVTNTSINLADFRQNTKLDAGYMLPNLSSFVLGEGFGGELLNFLIFVPAIDNLHLLELGRRVSDYIPQSELKFDKLLLTTESKLELATSLLSAPHIKFSLPIKVRHLETNSSLLFSSSLMVIASYLWDNLSGSNWDSISDLLWDNLG